jgi:protein ImuA
MNKHAALGDIHASSLTQGLKPGMWLHYHAGAAQQLLSLGSPSVDERLRGGIARNGLHELAGEAQGDNVAASAFALMLALRLPETGQRIFWIIDETRQPSDRLYPHGIAELGGDPAMLLLIRAANVRDALRATADCIKSKAAGAVILEAQGSSRSIDLTATRRLALGAAEAGVLALLVREGAGAVASAAMTRWQIGSAPSQPLPADAPGLPAFDLHLLRHRSGIAPFKARVIWDHASRSFHDAPLSGRLSAAVTGGAVDQAAQRTA